MIMETIFTAAPWYKVEYAGFINIQTEPTYGGNNLLDMEVCKEANANADIMAAAPDMYEALEDVAAYFDILFTVEGVRNIPLENKVKQALSKATPLALDKNT